MNQEKNIKEMTQEERRQYRKQLWLKRREKLAAKTSFFSLAVLVPLFALIVLFLLVFPRSKVSQIENRQLAKFPKFTISSYFSGEFTTGIANWFNDTVPYRDSFKRMGTQFTGMMGFAGSEDTVTLLQTDIVAENMAGPADKPTEPSGPAATTATEAPEKKDKDYTKEEAENEDSNGLLIVKQDGHYKVLPLFGGGGASDYISTLNALQEQVSDDVTIYSMPVPLSSEFYLPSNAVTYSVSHDEHFRELQTKLNKDIVSINLCPVLAEHTEEPIYCRTDHHWQPLGAYYAVEAFAKAAGVPFNSLDKYQKGVNEGYVGTMYAFTGDSRILNDPEDFVYYKPTWDYQTYYYDTYFNYMYESDLFVDVDVDNSYLMFMGSDALITKIDTNVKNDRVLLLFKDSYGNAEVPFFTSSFEHIFVVDMRYFNRNLVNFIEEMGVTDVLFSMCSYSVVGVNAESMPWMLEQDPDSEIVDGGPTSTIDVPVNLLETQNGEEEETADSETVDGESDAAVPAEQNGPKNLLHTEDAQKFGIKETQPVEETAEEEE